MPEPLQGVLFDMDGLLVDSEPLWFEVESAVMARLGGSWGGRDQAALVGGSLDKSLDYLLAKATRAATRPAVARWMVDGMVELLSTREVPVMPGARQLLAEVAGAGVPYGLVTSSERPVMEAVLSRLEVTFPVTVCGDDVSHSKPDPEPYLLAAAKLGADPGGCVAIEDSPNGVAAAEGAGCITVAVPSIVPIPAADGRTVVSSLTELTLARLRDLAAAR
ncbi:MAG TPA: HAD family phosphatase [Streptosporangiaceae bacterium]|nr:HAD family phosphatase [Streptosporangiaceae bacterium]